MEMWGVTFKKLLEQIAEGVSVLQVDNARVVRKPNGTVSLSAESFKDSEKGSSWAFIDPAHHLLPVLQSISGQAGKRISSVWEPTNQAVTKLHSDKGWKYKVGISTLRASSFGI